MPDQGRYALEPHALSRVFFQAGAVYECLAFRDRTGCAGLNFLINRTVFLANPDVPFLRGRAPRRLFHPFLKKLNFMIVRSLLSLPLFAILAGCATWADRTAVVDPISRSEVVQLGSADYRAYLRSQHVEALRTLKAEPSKVQDLVLDFHSDVGLARQAEDLGIGKRADVQAMIENYRRQVLVATLMEDVQATTEREMPDLVPLARDRYTAELDSFKVPERRRAAHILLVPDPCSADASQKLMREAKRLRKRALAGEDFAELARQYSKDRTGRSGGVLPAQYAREGALVKPFEDVLFELKAVGDISEPVETAYGVHIIKLLDISAAHVKSFDEVQESLVKRLHAETLNSAMVRKRGENYPAIDTIDYAAIAPLVDEVIREKDALKSAGSAKGGAETAPAAPVAASN